jgi:CheY-like chemotaxis protein
MLHDEVDRAGQFAAFLPQGRGGLRQCHREGGLALCLLRSHAAAMSAGDSWNHEQAQARIRSVTRHDPKPCFREPHDRSSPFSESGDPQERPVLAELIMDEIPADLRVLLVDDDKDAALLLAGLLPLLTARPLSVNVAFDGYEALQVATGTVQPHVVVLDIEMPIMDGIEAAIAIRKTLGEAAPLLIAVSGHVQRVEVASRGPVFDHAFCKPVDADELIRLMLAAGDTVEQRAKR